ncbi:GAF domain-containing protein [Sphingomonas gilva]|uniref:histidine kinase n=1 Tax=Sphingomonas gilva TaxID=2305907 RepID=A0A396S451_9SPHN|nr:HWE histidine kinase domain-containing protein [Sphingomonas gilva]RHW18195.1 GAF domain-containing protein [Sphingomonas gilva]
MSSEDGGKRQEMLRQQTVLAKFGELALKSEDLDEILTEACRLVGEALGTDLAKVVELQPDGRTLMVRAGVGWKPGVVGHTKMQVDKGSSEGHALETGEPVISSDIATETRFQYAPFLIDNGVRAMVNVIIIGAKERQPYGILQVDSRTPREFDDHDISFLRTYANLLAATVDRLSALLELRENAARQNVLLAELQHRSRNILAVVKAIAARSLSASPALEEFNARLSAISRVQGFLSRGQSWSVDLGELVQTELKAHGDGQADKATVEGPPVNLPGDKVQTLALVLHELATNAVKYGALSQPSGRLSVKWSVTSDDSPRLMFDWRESGVRMPAGDTPPRHGYGRELIEHALPYQLEAETQFEFTGDGVHCAVVIPLAILKPEGKQP